MSDNTNQTTSGAQQPTPAEAPQPVQPTKTPQWMRDIATASETVGQPTITPKLPNQVIMPNVSEAPAITKREPDRPHLSRQEIEEFIKEKKESEIKAKEVRERLLNNDKQLEEDRKNLEKIESDMQAEEDKIDQLLKSKFG